LIRDLSIRKPGDVLGHFELQELLGEGGAGQVWRARSVSDLGFTKTVALKVLSRESRSRKSSDSLLHEARLGSGLRHPNIVDVYEVGLYEGRVHVAMEFVDGGSLEDLIAACVATGVTIPPSVVVEIGIGIAKALSWAHTFVDEEGSVRNIVHRDLKPANVLLSRSGMAKVADFGLATVAGVPHTTTTGVVRGTPSYMAPEIWEGDRTYGPETDLFGLGCVLWEMTQLACLFDGDTVPQVYGRVAYGNPAEEAARVGSHCAGLVPIVEALIQRDPAVRTRDAKAAVLSLQGLQGELTGPSLQDFLSTVKPYETAGSRVSVEDKKTQLMPGRHFPELDRSPGRSGRWGMLALLALLLSFGSWQVFSSQSKEGVGLEPLHEPEAPIEDENEGRSSVTTPEVSTDPSQASDLEVRPPIAGEALSLGRDVDAGEGRSLPVGQRASHDEKIQESTKPPEESRSPVQQQVEAQRGEGNKAPGMSARGDRVLSAPKEGVEGVEGVEGESGAEPEKLNAAAPQDACLLLSSSPGGAQVWLDSARSPFIARSRARKGTRRAPGSIEVSMGGRTPQARVHVELEAGEAVEVSCLIGDSPRCTVKPAAFELCE